MSDQAAQTVVETPAAPAAPPASVVVGTPAHPAAQAQNEKSAAVADALKFLEESSSDAIDDGAPAQGGPAADVPSGARAGDAGPADVDGAAEGEPEAEVDGAAAGADPGDADADGEDTDPEGAGDDGAKTKDLPHRYAELKRKEKRADQRDAAADVREDGLNVRERSINQREQSLLEHAENYGRQFAEADKDFGAFAELYCKQRGVDFNDVVEALNRRKLGLGGGKPLAQAARQSAEASQTSELAAELANMKFLGSASRSIGALGDKYPLTKALDPMQFESVALQARDFLKPRLGREPNAEELFAPIEERLSYEAWKQERAKGSAPAKGNPAPAAKPASVQGNGESPAASEQTAEHGSGAPQANPRRATTLTQTDASVRTGAGRTLTDDQARRAAIDDALRGL